MYQRDDVSLIDQVKTYRERGEPVESIQLLIRTPKK